LKDFDDVVNCKNVEEFNQFVQEYLSERNLEGEDKKKTYWALFHRWKEATKQ